MAKGDIDKLVGPPKKWPNRKQKQKVTPQQYKVAWDLVSTGHTVQQVLAATGLTKAQLAWLMKEGDEANGMPSFGKRICELSAQIRKRALEAADTVGQGTLDGLKRAVEITHVAQTTVRNLLAAYATNRVAPIVAKARNGQQLTDDDMVAMAMPASMRDTVRALKPYCDLTETAKAFKIVFGDPTEPGMNDSIDAMPKELRLDLSAESYLPAAVALVEETAHRADTEDLLDQLLPECRGWTVEQIEHYIETGEYPDDVDHPPPSVIDTEANGDEP